MIIEGEHTRFPIATTSKKHTCVSLSTPEAEIVAGNWAVMQEAIPIQIYMRNVLQKVEEEEDEDENSKPREECPGK